MNETILQIVDKMNEAWDGDPWFGRSVTSILGDIDEKIVFEKPYSQHSILELLWHMITWKEFVISRLQPGGYELAYFDENDWRPLDHSDKSLWRTGLKRCAGLQREMVALVAAQPDALLDETVSGRDYKFSQLLPGIVEHDIYHIGQIAYIAKMLKG